MRKLIIALAAAGMFALAAPALAADGTISGTVTHAADSSAIGSISLSAQNTSTYAITYASTTAAGTYSFTLAPGTYDVTPYTNVSSEPNITFIKKSLTVTIASGETKSGQNFALTRRGRFTGTVYAADGVTPIADAAVSSSNVSGYTYGGSYALTLSNGSYFATPSPTDTTASAIGSYTLYVTRAGYFGATITNVALTANETTVTQNITLTPGSTVSGTVRDSVGAPIANATVTITKSAGGTYSALTNASGAYTVSVYDLTNYNGSAVGDYPLSIAKTGYVTKTAAVSIAADGSALTGNDFALVAAGTITGTITSSTGGGLSGATVTANDGFGGSYAATTDASGVYTLANLKPSTQYTLTVTKTNYVGQKAYNVAVTAGATVSGKNFTLPPAKTFSGTVLAKSNNAAVEGAIVSLYKRNKTRSEVADFSFTTKSDGGFIFGNVSPGKYRVKILKNGYINAVVDSIAITADVSGKVYKLDLAGSIRGNVYTANNVAVPSADIAVFALNNGKEVAYSTTTSDENGNFLVSALKKGTYRLKITTTEFVTRLVNITVKTGTQTTKNIKLNAAGSVSGYITDKETGLPVTALVRVVGTAISAWSDANGYYVIDGVPPGNRRLVAVSAYYNTSSQKAVGVSVGKTKTGVNFAITPRQ
ncbi:MAG: carboxypeptidase regulatory-like domain-containing protein [Candidatus Kerfeldbacteria bacterium]|nr:carboxypeptidase regulatory-like domain-containing protein [Candidatus Kerfeldbacteria bacterium]